MFNSQRLRLGRRSLPGHDYLITIVTRKRQPYFAEFLPASSACQQFYAEAVERHGQTLSFVVMPDHIHWLLRLEGDLSQAVRLYKAKVSLSVGTRVWQDGFHDHALRDDDDLRRVARYIVANPLRAGLVKDIGNYPYWNAIWL